MVIASSQRKRSTRALKSSCARDESNTSSRLYLRVFRGVTRLRWNRRVFATMVLHTCDVVACSWWIQWTFALKSSDARIHCVTRLPLSSRVNAAKVLRLLVMSPRAHGEKNARSRLNRRVLVPIASYSRVEIVAHSLRCWFTSESPMW